MPVTEDGGRSAKDRAPRRRRGRISWLPQPRPGSAALVTGASSGLGAELARSLAARGHDLVLVARRRDRLDALAQRLSGQGVRVHAVDCDLTEPGAGEFLAAAVAERVLEISVLCNNAGAAIAGEFTTYRVERQVAVLRLNLEATVDLCGRFIPSMVRRGSGAVLNVGSLFSYAPAPRLATYAASKLRCTPSPRRCTPNFARTGSRSPHCARARCRPSSCSTRGWPRPCRACRRRCSTTPARWPSTGSERSSGTVG